MSEREPESLRGRTFKNRTLRQSRFIGCDLGDVVVRGSDVAGLEVDSPWLLEGGNRLLVNGVDVVPLVDAELNIASRAGTARRRASRGAARRLGCSRAHLVGHAGPGQDDACRYRRYFRR